MRRRYNEQLEEVHVELIKMGALCEDAIDAAIKALFKHDDEMIEKAEQIESDLDDKQREIESMCMQILLKQQPVAGDLRNVSSAMMMISDMERIGDQGQDIAEITRYITGEDIVGGIHIKKMADETKKMVTDSVESFVKGDVGLAGSVILSDDKVDELFEKVREELIAEIRRDSERGARCIDIIMIAKYLERIGDHATNIAEWVIYSVTGEHKRVKKPQE